MEKLVNCSAKCCKRERTMRIDSQVLVSRARDDNRTSHWVNSHNISRDVKTEERSIYIQFQLNAVWLRLFANAIYANTSYAQDYVIMQNSNTHDDLLYIVR